VHVVAHSSKHRGHAIDVALRPQWLPARADGPGIVLCAALGAVALALGRALPPSPFLSNILVALFLGALAVNTPLRALLGLAPISNDREPDRFAAGTRFVGKWALRLAIVLMGFKMQTQSFGRQQIALIFGVAAASIPSAFFVAHAAASVFGVRRALADLLAGGTMICGASAVNAIAPVCGARREEQGIAIATVFLFSVFALLAFRPVAAALGLDSAHAGLWSGLAVNDLSSAIAVGNQMGGEGGTLAAASKSARILMLAPVLVLLALVRRRDLAKPAAPSGVKKSIVEGLPGFLLGYIVLAFVRAGGDRALGAASGWAVVVRANEFAVDALMVTVSAGIGLHLEVQRLLAAGVRAIAVGGAAAFWMAGLTLGMIALAAKGSGGASAFVGLAALLGSGAAYRAATAVDIARRALERRFESGAPLSLAEAMRLLDALEARGDLSDATLKRLLFQLHPSIGELIPVRESPLPHGEGCRWITYWEGKSGWALVAVCREPGSATPIHAHSHRLLGKSIEGRLEELRFVEKSGAVELASKKQLAHEDIVETDGLSTLHLVRVLGDSSAIDLQLRGPELGEPGRRLRTRAVIDFATLAVGERLEAEEEVDDRPGQAGEGARAGRHANITPRSAQSAQGRSKGT
jgi:uncharacterized integral membrane protein (TIGR00698 family)